MVNTPHMVNNPHENCKYNCYHMHPDEDVWVRYLDTKEELEGLFKYRRSWVSRIPMTRNNGDMSPARLSENFIMIFKTIPPEMNNTPGPKYTIEGIDGTGLVIVRSRKDEHESFGSLADDVGELANETNGVAELVVLDIYVYRSLDDASQGPWLFSAHMEIDKKPGTISKRLLKAKHDSENYFSDLSNSEIYQHHLYNVPPGGAPIETSLQNTVTFECASNLAEPEVIYQGRQKLATFGLEEDPPPPSCNPIYGTCVEDDNGDLICSVDTVTIKSYEGQSESDSATGVQAMVNQSKAVIIVV